MGDFGKEPERSEGSEGVGLQGCLHKKTLTVNFL